VARGNLTGLTAGLSRALASRGLPVRGRRRRYLPTLAVEDAAVEAWLLDNEAHATLRENHIGEVHVWLAERLCSMT
jgi:hypothetical protein